MVAMAGHGEPAGGVSRLCEMHFSLHKPHALPCRRQRRASAAEAAAAASKEAAGSAVVSAKELRAKLDAEWKRASTLQACPPPPPRRAYPRSISSTCPDHSRRAGRAAPPLVPELASTGFGCPVWVRLPCPQCRHRQGAVPVLRPFLFIRVTPARP